MTKKRIVFILPNLTVGGAERVISFVAQNLDPKEYNVTLLVIERNSGKSYTIGNNINTIYLNKTRVLKAIPSLFKYIKQNKPDIVVSCLAYLNIIVGFISLFLKKPKYIAREGTVIGARGKSKSFSSKLFALLIRITYPLYDRIICQSIDMKLDLNLNYNVPDKKMTIINNPITNNKLECNKEKINYDRPIKYITVGRMVDVKGHLRLLKILSKLLFDFKYTLIGEGPKQNEIFEMIEAYGMSDKITHIPYTNKVDVFLCESDVFLQGSYVEGFPNTVLESCVVGTPAIAFDAPGGTKEIIENGVNGYIVENESEFIDKLNLKTIWDANQISTSVQQKFGKEIILKNYSDLFQSVCN